MTKQNMAEKIKVMAESSNVEFKTCSDGRLTKDIAETISAFSNTDGGCIVMGATPEGELTGLSTQEIDKL